MTEYNYATAEERIREALELLPDATTGSRGELCVEKGTVAYLSRTLKFFYNALKDREQRAAARKVLRLCAAQPTQGTLVRVLLEATQELRVSLGEKKPERVRSLGRIVRIK